MSVSQNVRSKKLFSYRLVLGGKDYGWWDGGGVKLGGEVIRDTDPELGEVLVGGAKSGDSLDLSRLWQDGRDDVANDEFVRGRLSLEGHADLYRMDAVGQPTSSTPIRSMPCLLSEVTVPESDSKSGDSSRHEITVEVTA